MKKCTGCKKEKSLSEFSKNQYRCKKCNKEYKQKNKIKEKEYFKNWSKDNKRRKEYQKKYQREYSRNNLVMVEGNEYRLNAVFKELKPAIECLLILRNKKKILKEVKNG